MQRVRAMLTRATTGCADTNGRTSVDWSGNRLNQYGRPYQCRFERLQAEPVRTDVPVSIRGTIGCANTNGRTSVDSRNYRLCQYERTYQCRFDRRQAVSIRTDVPVSIRAATGCVNTNGRTSVDSNGGRLCEYERTFSVDSSGYKLSQCCRTSCVDWYASRRCVDTEWYVIMRLTTERRDITSLCVRFTSKQLLCVRYCLHLTWAYFFILITLVILLNLIILVIQTLIF